MPKLDKKTFYLYDYSNNLFKRAKKIYSPYNVKTKSVVVWDVQYAYNNPDSVTFKDWQYTADRKELWDLIFEQQLEWLSFFNSRGWILSKWWTNQKYLNWKKFKGDNIHKIESEKINTWPEAEVKTVTEKVEIQQIPEIVAQNMDVAQLKVLANTWEVELPENILDAWDAEVIKSKIISILKEAWNIK